MPLNNVLTNLLAISKISHDNKSFFLYVLFFINVELMRPREVIANDQSKNREIRALGASAHHTEPLSGAGIFDTMSPI